MQQTTFIVRDGEVIGLEHFIRTLRFLRTGEYTLTVKRKSRKRSIDQNRLMWAWFRCIEEDTGTPAQKVHDYYCFIFLPQPVEFNGYTFTLPGHTKGLSTDEMTNFLNNVQADAATELHIMLPSPDDKDFDVFFQKYDK